ncbi:coil containing protein [Vibrio phage 1.182.O._10N.286.46.E1]|nr:coil containing protein [Vibrio phage 1.182.O._10N.286.46.E1]
MFYDNSGAPVRKNYSLDEFQGDTMEGISAAFSQSLQETFTGATWRSNELIRANLGQGEVKYGAYSPSLGYDRPMVGVNKKLSNEEASKQVKDAGLPLKVPDDGYTQEALDIVMSRKREELMRKKQMDDAEGFVAGAGKFGAGMAAQLLDPVNIGVSFVPVIGPTKYMSWLAAQTSAAGRAGVRAGVGAVEGLAGAAIVEPAIYQAMTREQADYTMADSLINIGLGTVLGGGLHMGMGAVSDAVKRTGSKIPQEPKGSMSKTVDSATPQTREAMLRTSMQMEAQGYKLDVESVAATDPNVNAITKAMNEESSAKVYYHGTNVDFEKFDISKFGANEQQGDYVGQAIFFTESKDKAMRYAKQAGGDIIKKAELEIKNPLIIKDGAPKGYFNSIEPSKYLDDADIQYMKDSGMSKEEIKESAFYEMTEQQKADYAISKGYDGMIDHDYGQTAVFNPEQIKLISDDSVMPPNPSESQSVQNTVREGFSPSNKRGADKDASLEADAKLSEGERTIDEELEDMEGLFEEYIRYEYGEATSAKAVMKDYDEAIKDAELDAKALTAATLCRLTK